LTVIFDKDFNIKGGTVQICNFINQPLFEKQLSEIGTSLSLNIKTLGLTSGTYFLIFRNENGQILGRKAIVVLP
jgi:hypothetical protein